MTIGFVWAPLVLASACVGAIGDGSNELAPDVTIADMPEGGLATTELRRLTAREYELTLRDLFGDMAIDATAVVLSTVPSDDGESYSTMARGVAGVHVDAYWQVADAVADHYAADTTQLSSIEACFSDAPDQACIDGFIDRFGRQVFRRPLTDDERATMASLYSEGQALSAADGVRLVLMYMLQAPPFLYRVEIDGPGIGEHTYELSDFELATRLSYFAWGSTPDELLLDAAQDGSLRAELDEHVDRLLADPRARAQVEHFFGEWLGIDALPSVMGAETIADDMANELNDFIEHHVFSAESDYGTLLTSPLAFVPSEPLAQLYGASVGETELPESERAGLITRAAMLLGQGDSTHPILRGARIRKQLLCEDLAPPDPSQISPDKVVPPPFDPDKTARTRWTEQTSDPICASCHQGINPFGFVLENYDNLGRYRTMEPILDPTTGAELNSLPIDATVEVFINGEPTTVTGATGLSEALASSDQASRCFARQWVRFTFGRADGAEDSALIDELDAAAAGDTGSMLRLFKAVASTAPFQLRRIAP